MKDKVYSFFCLLTFCLFYATKQAVQIYQIKSFTLTLHLEDQIKKINFEKQISYGDLLNQLSINGEKYCHFYISEYQFYSNENISIQLLKGDEIFINQATQEEWETLKGVKAKTSSKIIKYQQIRQFRKVSDLTLIPGIKEKKLLAWKSRLCI